MYTYCSATSTFLNEADTICERSSQMSREAFPLLHQSLAFNIESNFLSLTLLLTSIPFKIIYRQKTWYNTFNVPLFSSLLRTFISTISLPILAIPIRKKHVSKSQILFRLQKLYTV